MIQNIVFDIGNVLADFRLKEFLADQGFDAAMIKRIIKASVLSPFWGQYERAELTVEEAFQGFASCDPEIDQELRKAYASVEGMLTIRPYAIDLVRKLKEAGYGVYYLSNYSEKAYRECGESLAFMPYMDGGLVSFQVGQTKPDPRMYQLLLEQYHLQAEECLFIDDTEENVIVAQSLGFEGLVFKSLDQLQVEIMKYMVPEITITEV